MKTSNCEQPNEIKDNNFEALVMRRLYTRKQPFVAMRIAMARGRGHALEGREIEAEGWYPQRLELDPRKLRQAYLRGYGRVKRYVMVAVKA